MTTDADGHQWVIVRRAADDSGERPRAGWEEYWCQRCGAETRVVTGVMGRHIDPLAPFRNQPCVPSATWTANG
jgi:hypothetical protein